MKELIDVLFERMTDRDSYCGLKAYMDKRGLEKRTKAFALCVIGFTGCLPKDKVADVLGYHVLKSGTAVGANYREANRAESRKDFIHKISIVEKEASETQHWLELLDQPGISSVAERHERQWLLRESGQLVAIFKKTGKTAKSNTSNSRFEFHGLCPWVNGAAAIMVQ